MSNSETFGIRLTGDASGVIASAKGASKAAEDLAAGMSRAGQAAKDAGARMTAGMGEAGRAAREAAEAQRKLAEAAAAAQQKMGGWRESIKGLRDIALTASGVIYTFKQVADVVGAASSALFEAGGRAEKQARIFAFTNGSAVAAAKELAFVREAAERLGLDLATSADAYGKLAAAAKGTTLAGQGARDIFLAISKASTVMGLSASETQGALLAISQIISKGTVSAEELRGQLGERLPGAFQIAARAMGVTTAELGKMLETGAIASTDFLPKFAAELEKTLGDSPQSAAGSAQASLNRLSNAWESLKQTIANSGFLDQAAKAMRGLAQAVDSVNTSDVAQRDRLKKRSEELWGFAFGEQSLLSPDQRRAFQLEYQAAVSDLLAIERKIEADARAKDAGKGSAADSFAAREAQRAEQALARTTVDPKLLAGRKEALEFIEKFRSEAAKTAAELHKLEGMRPFLGIAEYEQARAEILRRTGGTDLAAQRRDEVERLAKEAEKELAVLAKIREDRAKLDERLRERLDTVGDRAGKAAGEFGTGLIQRRGDLAERREELGKTPQEVAKLQALRGIERDFEKARERITETLGAIGDTEGIDRMVGELQRLAETAKGEVVEGLDAIDARQRELAADWRVGAGEALRKFTEQARDMAAQTEQAITSAFRGMEDALVQFVKTGKLDFRSLADSIISDLIRIQVRESMVKVLGSTGGVGGLIGSVIKLITGSGGQGSVQGNPDYIYDLHSGGIAGLEASRVRLASSSLHARAPRYHSGLMPNEFPAILQRGEGVFTPAQMRALGAGRGVTVNQTIQVSTGVAQTVRAEIASMLPQIQQATLAGVVDARQRGGGVAEAFA